MQLKSRVRAPLIANAMFMSVVMTCWTAFAQQPAPTTTTAPAPVAAQPSTATTAGAGTQPAASSLPVAAPVPAVQPAAVPAAQPAAAPAAQPAPAATPAAAPAATPAPAGTASAAQPEAKEAPAPSAPDPNSPWIIKDSSSHARRSRLDFTGQIHPGSIFVLGLGGALYLPIVPDGFIGSLNDTFGLEFGALWEYFNNTNDYGVVEQEHTWMGITPLGGVRWDFHLTRLITVFSMVKMGYQIGFNDNYVTRVNGEERRNVNYVRAGISNFAINAGVGAYFHFGDRFALRVETGYRSLLAVGVSLAL